MRTLRNFATPMEYYSRYEGSLTGTSTQQPTIYASACRRLVGFDAKSSSAIPDSLTGSRSGNWATRDRFPPMASMVFLSVDSKRSLRCSRRDTLSCVIPSFLAIRTCVSLRACRSSRKVISSAINSAARASTFFRWRGRNFLILSSTFVAMLTPFPSSVARDAHQNGHRPCGSTRDKTAFR